MNKAILLILVVVAGAGWITAWNLQQEMNDLKIRHAGDLRFAAANYAAAEFYQGRRFLMPFESATEGSTQEVAGVSLPIRNPLRETNPEFLKEFNQNMQRLVRQSSHSSGTSEATPSESSPSEPPPSTAEAEP